MIAQMLRVRGLNRTEALRREGEIARIEWSTFSGWARTAGQSHRLRLAVAIWRSNLEAEQANRPCQTQERRHSLSMFDIAHAQREMLERTVQHYLRQKYIGN